MNGRVRSAAIIAAIVALDRVSKVYIRDHFSPFDTRPVIAGFFNIVHTENPGAAFGFLTDSHAEWRRPLLILVSMTVMAIIGSMLFRQAEKKSALLETALALVFGGAAGNLWDRAFRGTVTDFLQFFFGSYEFPSFNVADSAITVGACLLLIDVWIHRGKRDSSR
ncbi:MAG TPA: signal peptidase II [Bryobacteraceae bacterium]|nr:signal peptidase II [Bryobacteraceae bacterium]